jgi:YjbE family integral membrane protein
MTDLASNADGLARLAAVFWLNVVLSVDNAVVIALAVGRLPQQQRRAGLLIGAVAATALRIAATLSLSFLAWLPWVRIVGAVLLLWIGVKLLLPGAHDQRAPEQSRDLFRAVRIILLADITMSLDNILAVYAAANGSAVHIALGLAASIPLAVLASGFMLALVNRLPAVILLGAGIIGFVAGQMGASDIALRDWLVDRSICHDMPITTARAACEANHLEQWRRGAGAIGALAVIAIGSTLRRRARQTSL